MRSVQLLSEEYVARSAALSVTERLEFLEEFRLLLPLSVFEEERERRLAEWQAFEGRK